MAEFSAYTPKQWRQKEFIKASDLNHIEQGIGLNNELIEDLIENGTGISEEIKNYVDDSINQSSAYFRGSFATKAALLAVQWQTASKSAPYYVSNNDYAVVEEDESHSNETWRYSYVYEKGGSNNGWTAQYRVNEKTETMTLAQYETLTSAQKMDGTIRFITDANSYPDAGGVGF